VQSGDTCGVIEGDYSITLAQFILMNPEINSECSNIDAGEAYCVQTSNWTVPSNVASGTITAGCTEYYTVQSGDSCGIIEGDYNITLDQFIAMNPEVNSECSNIDAGEAYCVQSSNSTSTSGSGGGGSSSAPSNLATGSFSNCTTYHTVVSGDSCASMETMYNIAQTDLFRWNPEISTSCSNIDANDAYCVGGGGDACTKVYTVVSGDYCSEIETNQDITETQLYALNSWLDSNCDLQVGENLCVG